MGCRLDWGKWDIFDICHVPGLTYAVVLGAWLPECKLDAAASHFYGVY